jgi:hypothetical protein
MNRRQYFVSCLAICSMIDATATAQAANVQTYNILPGGLYTYFSSTFGPGIPGCNPTDVKCDFSIHGTFSVELDDSLSTARFTDFDLRLTGNENIQNHPPEFAPVTADRVEAWLSARVFEPSLIIDAPFVLYFDSHFQTLSYKDNLDGTVLLSGGYNRTLVDGDGLNFQVLARAIPEPGTAAFAGLVLLLALGVRTPRRQICSFMRGSETRKKTAAADGRFRRGN